MQQAHDAALEAELRQRGVARRLREQYDGTAGAKAEATIAVVGHQCASLGFQQLLKRDVARSLSVHALEARKEPTHVCKAILASEYP
jgi:hypothetical protein